MEITGCSTLIPAWCRRVSEPAAFLHLDVAVENGTGGLAPARPLTWQVEYPGQDPEAQKDKLVWEIQVSERDVRALVPLVQVGVPILFQPSIPWKRPLISLCFQELEILNTAPLTGIPRVIPVKLVAVEAGGGVSELTDPIGCESADKQVLQVSPAVPSLSCCTLGDSHGIPHALAGVGFLRHGVRGGQGEPRGARGPCGFLGAPAAGRAELLRLGSTAPAPCPAGRSHPGAAPWLETARGA